MSATAVAKQKLSPALVLGKRGRLFHLFHSYIDREEIPEKKKPLSLLQNCFFLSS